MNPLTKYLLSSVARLPEGEAGAAPPDQGGADGDALRETLAFDPATFFAPPAEKGQDGGEGEEPAGGGQESGAGAASTAKPDSASPPPAEGQGQGEGEDPRMAELRAAVAGFLEKKPAAEGQADTQPKPQATAPDQPRGEAPKDGEFKGYSFSVPDEIVNGLAHEEPGVRKQALGALVNGVATRLAQDFGQAMAHMAKTIREEAVRDALGQVDSRTNEQKVRDDFYGANPDIKELVDNLPHLDGVIWAVSHQIAQQSGQKNWTQQLRDQTAATIRLQLKLPQRTAAAQPQGNGARSPRRASFSAGGGGPSGSPNGQGSQNDFMSVLNAGS